MKTEELTKLKKEMDFMKDVAQTLNDYGNLLAEKLLHDHGCSSIEEAEEKLRQIKKEIKILKQKK
jgi:hypothetical protein